MDEMIEESRKREPRTAGEIAMADDGSIVGVSTRLSMLIRIQKSRKVPSICSIGVVMRALEESGQI